MSGAVVSTDIVSGAVVSATVAIDLMAAVAALVWALTGARRVQGRLRATLGLLLATLTLLLLLRSMARLGWMADGWAVLVALALPLAILLCAEAVRGVHAPRWAKAAVTVAPALVLVLVLVLGLAGLAGSGAVIVVWAAAALVLGTLTACAWWVRPRDRGGARARVGLLFALAFALAIPLVATDFMPDGRGVLLPDGQGVLLPDGGGVRLGGLAVLLGVALGARLTSTGGDVRAALSLLTASVLLVAGLVVLLLAVGAIGSTGWVATACALLAALLLADVLTRSVGLAARAEELAYLRALAGIRTDGGAGEALASLDGVPALANARLLGPDDLRDHDVEALRAAMDDGVLRDGAIDDPVVADEAAHLFALHDADHMLLVSREPFRIAMLRTGPEDVAAVGLRLRVIARLLALVDLRKGTP